MANKKITELDALTTPAGADVLAIVDDVAGTATTKKVTVTNLMTLAPAIDATSVEAAGALMDSEVTNLAQVKAFDSSAYATAAQGTLADSATQPSDLGTAAAKDVGTSNGNVVELDATGLPAVDGSQLLNLPSPDVNTPLTTAFRGTDNPHIGAYPNQSFKVTDNPSKSVMVVADADGNVTYILKDSAAEVRVAKGASGTPSRFALASDLPVFVLENDTGEPDIEVTEPNTGNKISVISGDGDERGVNNLPTIQGFQIPDIGANPAPLLISGGSIA